MKITKEWLKEKSACADGQKWFEAQSETDGIAIVGKLMAEQRFDWANWLVARVIKRKQNVAYAIFSARQVLDIYEKKYPGDKRPRLAIEAAEKCLLKNNSKNREAASAAARAASEAAKKEMQTKIINYGLNLLVEK